MPAEVFVLAGSSAPSLCQHSIGTEWSLLLEACFDRQATDGEVRLWTPGRTIYASVFHTNNSEAEEAIEKMIEGRPGIPVQSFDRGEPDIVGHAYLLPEQSGTHNYWGLNTWTAVKGSVACVTIYFREIGELDWAVRVWKSVRPRRGSEVFN
jgi:hypothetical protein